MMRALSRGELRVVQDRWIGGANDGRVTARAIGGISGCSARPTCWAKSSSPDNPGRNESIGAIGSFLLLGDRRPLLTLWPASWSRPNTRSICSQHIDFSIHLIQESRPLAPNGEQ
jgi:hypothetical protein